MTLFRALEGPESAFEIVIPARRAQAPEVLLA